MCKRVSVYIRACVRVCMCVFLCAHTWEHVDCIHIGICSCVYLRVCVYVYLLNNYGMMLSFAQCLISRCCFSFLNWTADTRHIYKFLPFPLEDILYLLNFLFFSFLSSPPFFFYFIILLFYFLFSLFFTYYYYFF